MKLRAVALAMVLAALLAACVGGPGASSRSNTFVIGAIYPLTGPQAPGGHEELSGVQLAVELAKRHGLFGDRDVRVLTRDAETPADAVKAVDAYIDHDHVNMLVGTYGSTLAEASAARADQRHVIYWETGAVADPVTQNKRYVFRTVAAGSTLGRTAVDFTDRVLFPANHVDAAAANVVIVHVDDVYGRSVADGEVQQAAHYGIRNVREIAYNANAYDAAAVVRQVASLHPGFLLDVSYIDDGIAIWKQVVEQKLHLLAAVGTSSAFCMPQFGQRLGSVAVGVYAADKPDEDVSPSSLTPAAQALLKEAEQLYAQQHKGAAMHIPAMAGFVSGWTLFHDVLPHAGSQPTADSLRSAALAVNVSVGGAVNGGGVRFGSDGSTDEGQNQLAASVVGQWQYRGKLEMNVVYPNAYARSQPLNEPVPMGM